MLYYKKDELKRLTDFELIQLMVKNNKTVIEFVFYEKCATLLKYIANEVFKNQITRDELISEFYLYLRQNDWQRIKDFQGRSKLTTWLSVVAVRFFLKKKETLIDSVVSSPLYKEIPEKKSDINPYEDIVRKMDLMNAIHRLQSPRDRYIILALEIEGRDVDVVAQELNVSKANLYNIKKRSLEKLSKLLIDYKL